ncbi:type IV secretion system protein VirB9 [Helicobacter apodemus]|uniref:Type IV secretion system protein VirB9 n=1 Tax=Helicobacter apodemus TaxID=135569 RepID=A0A4U8UEW1_9HELI|nr:TrbG/VirB9 family P-type conjugative transfer protein [Helicobacter apodemus]TLE15942.1 type IV secretion system protein VirB9 [Helicobacter apodemus]
MKKLIIFTILLQNILFANPNALNQATIEDIMQERQEEVERIMATRQQSGESLFTQKPTIENKDKYISNNVSINNTSSNIDNYPQMQYEQQYSQEIPAYTEEQLLLMKQAIRNKDLRAVQKKFLEKKYTGFENTIQIPYEENKTQKIRTRFTMATTIIFESKIESYILGDQSGYKVEEIPNMPNAISIKPFLIGIDTNLTIFTKDKKIHNFFLYSTDYKNKELPNLLVKILDDESKILTQKQMEEEARKYFVIKEGIAEIKVEKEQMDFSYIKKAKKYNEWLIPSEVFNDDTFTYFKYDKKQNGKVPVIFAVIDKHDTPVETKVIGDWIIAESRNDKWTIWNGESYVCIEKVKPNNQEQKVVE